MSKHTAYPELKRVASAMPDPQIIAILDSLTSDDKADRAMFCADRTQALDLPSIGGAYIVAIWLDQPQKLPISRLGNPEMPAGVYLYVGSACGPGGIRARVTRHFRTKKIVHWHIDHMTKAAAALGACALPGAKECEIVSRLALDGSICPAVKGFGSSDCRNCSSHLLFWSP